MKKYPFDLERALKGELLVNGTGEDILGFHKRLNRYTDDVYPYADIDNQIYTKKGKYNDGMTNSLDLFMKYPPLKEGDEILVRDDDNDKWQPRTFITFDSRNKVLCVNGLQNNSYKNGDNYGAVSWKYFKRIHSNKTHKGTVMLCTNVTEDIKKDITNKIKDILNDISNVESFEFEC